MKQTTYNTAKKGQIIKDTKGIAYLVLEKEPLNYIHVQNLKTSRFLMLTEVEFNSKFSQREVEKI